MPFGLGIDVGTTNAKAALVADDGTLAAMAVRPIVTRRDGDVAEQDPEELWLAVVEAVRAAAGEAPEAAAGVVAVGVCSQYSSIVPVDDAGRPTADLVLYLDQRGTAPSYAVLERHPEALEVWFERHGIPPVGGGLSLGHVLAIQHTRPEVHAATTAYLEVMDFVIRRLTGELAATQCTQFTTQLCDNRSLGTTAYDDDLVRMAGVDPAKLPPLVANDAVIGPILPAVAEQLSIPATARVVAGMNDSHAGAYATGAFTPGRAGIAIGTTSVLLDTVDHMGTDVDHEVLAMPSPEPDTYLVWAENGIGGKALEHVLENVVYAVDPLGDHVTDDQFAALDATLRSVSAGAGGVLFLPWLNGSYSPKVDPAMRGGFLNLSLDSGRTHLIRAVVEGIAHNLRWLLPVVEHFAGSGVEEITFSGGAARSAVWAQILADVLDRPVSPLVAPDAAVARSVGLVALQRIGVIAEPVAEGGLVRTAATYEPQADHRAGYDAMHAQFEAAFEALRPISHALNQADVFTLPDRPKA